MLKKYKLNVTFVAFQWDGSNKQLSKYKWLREAIEGSRIIVNVSDAYTEDLNIEKNIFYEDMIDYIVPGDYIAYYKKENAVILIKKKDFLKDMIEIK